jgi:hypothetical protein
MIQPTYLFAAGLVLAALLFGALVGLWHWALGRNNPTRAAMRAWAFGVVVLFCLAAASVPCGYQFIKQSPSLRQVRPGLLLRTGIGKVSRGDTVFLDVNAARPGPVGIVVGLPGDYLVWRDGEISLLTAPPAEGPDPSESLQVAVRIPEGQVAVAPVNPDRTPNVPETEFVSAHELRARVAFTLPAW